MFYNLMIPIYKGRERRRFKDSKFMIWLGGVRSKVSVPDTMQGKARCIKGSGYTWAYSG